MVLPSTSLTILMADDDEDDRMLTAEAFQEAHLANTLRFVEDGEELMDYLLRRGQYVDPDDSPRPGLILLDLNMPKMDGREALQAIREDPDLKRIPVVVLTTSVEEEDVHRSYDMGANSYITKPVSFEGLTAAVRSLTHYWFEIVTMPDDEFRA